MVPGAGEGASGWRPPGGVAPLEAWLAPYRTARRPRAGESGSFVHCRPSWLPLLRTPHVAPRPGAYSVVLGSVPSGSAMWRSSLLSDEGVVLPTSPATTRAGVPVSGGPGGLLGGAAVVGPGYRASPPILPSLSWSATTGRAGAWVASVLACAPPRGASRAWRPRLVRHDGQVMGASPPGAHVSRSSCRSKRRRHPSRWCGMRLALTSE